MLPRTVLKWLYVNSEFSLHSISLYLLCALEFEIDLKPAFFCTHWSFSFMKRWWTEQSTMNDSKLNCGFTIPWVFFNSRLPWWLSGKEPTWDAGDVGWIPGLGRSPGEGQGNPLQYSCLGNPTDRGAWQLQFVASQRVGHD